MLAIQLLDSSSQSHWAAAKHLPILSKHGMYCLHRTAYNGDTVQASSSLFCQSLSARQGLPLSTCAVHSQPPYALYCTVLY